MRLDHKIRQWQAFKRRPDLAEPKFNHGTVLAYRDKMVAANPEILCFGDSVWERVSRFDVDLRPLNDQVTKALGPQRTMVVNFLAFHMGVFLPMLTSLRDAGGSPKVVVLPFNVRSMSPQWYLDPKATWDWEIGQMRGEEWWDDPEKRYELQYGRKSLRSGGRDISLGEFWELLRVERRPVPRRTLIFECHYQYETDPNHERLQQLRDCIKVVHDMGGKAFVYAVPLNVEGGVSLLGETFRDHIAGHVAVIRDAALEADRFEDYTGLMPARAYFHKLEPTEHLNAVGRRRMRRRIVSGVRRLDS